MSFWSRKLTKLENFNFYIFHKISDTQLVIIVVESEHCIFIVQKAFATAEEKKAEAVICVETYTKRMR